jgi:HlyD family secretion protein
MADGLALIAQYESEASEIRHAPEPLQARMVVFLLTGLFGSLVIISMVFPIDRVVSSQFGQVVTVQPTTVLQALDASIIKSIDVNEGQHVTAGTVLATLDPTFAAADVSALRLQMASLDAEIARADAELAGKRYLARVTGDPISDTYANMQQANYLQRKQQFDSQVAYNNSQIDGARATLAKLSKDAALYGDRLRVAAEAEGLRNQLEDMHVGARLNTLAATDIRLEMARNVEIDRNSMAETTHLLAGYIATRDAFIQQWMSTTSQELVTASNARDTARTSLDKANRHHDLVRVTAPEDAVVLSLAKLSVGSVLKEGDALVTLASLKSPVEAEIDVAARDVGFVRAGDPVTIKFDAYQFVEHGSASGKVLWISEGTFTTDPVSGTSNDSDGKPVAPYYKAKIGFADVRLHSVPDNFRLIPGMTLTADIHVGTRSLFMYMVRGLIRGVDESMREP